MDNNQIVRRLGTSRGIAIFIEWTLLKEERRWEHAQLWSGDARGVHVQWGETGIWFQMRIEVFMSLVVILFFQELNADDRWPSDGALIGVHRGHSSLWAV